MWIESHQSLARHPKTLRLARALRKSVPAAIGHLHLLWWWALEHASPGSLDNVSGKEVAEVCMWRGRPAELLRALTEAGLLDAGRTIHDWADYTGRLLDRRRANRDRMRLARATHVQNKSDAPASEAQDTCEATVPNRTVPDSTVPYLTEPGTTQQDTTQPGPDVPGATLPDATQQDTTPREGADAVLCDVDGLPDGETPDGETPDGVTEERDGEPSWYAVLKTLPGGDVSLGAALDWLNAHDVPDSRAEDVATGLAAKWGGPDWKYTDAWAAFRNWVLLRTRRETNRYADINTRLRY